MKVISINSGSKPAKKGVYVQFSTTNQKGGIKLSPDLCLENSIAEEDKLVFGNLELDAEDGVGITGLVLAFRKANAADEKSTAFGTKVGSYLNGSNAVTWEQARSAAYAGQELKDNEIISYSISSPLATEEGNWFVLMNPTVRTAVLRVKGSGASKGATSVANSPTPTIVELAGDDSSEVEEVDVD